MKDLIRKEVLNKRKEIPLDRVISKSKSIFHRLKDFYIYQQSQNVMVYIDFRNEVKTDFIIEDLLAHNKKVLIPISIKETKEMILSEISNPKTELTEGTYGILEPKPEYIKKVDPKIIDLIITPGVAFDRRGYRIGYGGGYYDRFLDKLPKTIPCIALAFDFQIVNEIPNDSFDKPVDYIITETQTIKCK